MLNVIHNGYAMEKSWLRETSAQVGGGGSVLGGRGGLPAQLMVIRDQPEGREPCECLETEYLGKREPLMQPQV